MMLYIEDAAYAATASFRPLPASADAASHADAGCC